MAPMMIFWFVLVVMAFSACVIISLQSYNRYETKNTVVTIEKDHYYWNTSMPSITICPTVNRISMKKLDAYCEKEKIQGTDKSEFYQFIESLANSTYTNFENIKDFPSIEVYAYACALYGGAVYCYTGPIFYRLTEDWSRRTEGERKVRGIFDLEFVVTEQVLTEYGICYMTNNHLTKHLSTSTLIFGTEADSPFDEKFYQNVKLHQVVSGNLFDGDLNYNFVGFEDEIMLFVHSPYETINIAKLSYYSNFAVEFHCFTNEIVTDENFQAVTRVSQRGCRFQSESNLTHYNFYTKGICLQECRLNVAYRICSCIPHFYPNKVAAPKPVCSYKQLKNCLSKHKDLLVKLRDEKNNAVYCPGCVQNCKDVNIFIDSFQVLEGTTDLLGTIGGLMIVKQYPMIRYKRKILFSFEDLIDHKKYPYIRNWMFAACALR
ncbi:hypothetical protein HA402_008919 [Bradysia odoriphaga]|nr:hypothetical protein HA402_008919 [Bradysia odoriphaga]